MFSYILKKNQIYETSKSFRLKHSLIKGRINEKILDIFVGKFTFLPNNKVIMQNCCEVQGTIQSCLTFLRYTITAKIEGQKVVFSLRIIFSKNILFKFWWYSYQYSKILLHGILFFFGGGGIAFQVIIRTTDLVFTRGKIRSAILYRQLVLHIFAY